MSAAVATHLLCSLLERANGAEANLCSLTRPQTTLRCERSLRLHGNHAPSNGHALPRRHRVGAQPDQSRCVAADRSRLPADARLPRRQTMRTRSGPMPTPPHTTMPGATEPSAVATNLSHVRLHA